MNYNKKLVLLSLMGFISLSYGAEDKLTQGTSSIEDSYERLSELNSSRFGRSRKNALEQINKSYRNVVSFFKSRDLLFNFFDKEETTKMLNNYNTTMQELNKLLQESTSLFSGNSNATRNQKLMQSLEELKRKEGGLFSLKKEASDRKKNVDDQAKALAAERRAADDQAKALAAAQKAAAEQRDEDAQLEIDRAQLNEIRDFIKKYNITPSMEDRFYSNCKSPFSPSTTTMCKLSCVLPDHPINEYRLNSLLTEEEEHWLHIIAEEFLMTRELEAKYNGLFPKKAYPYELED